MRHDMNKVLTTRPRVGRYSSGQGAYRKAARVRRSEDRYWKGVRDESAPKKESMRKPHKHRWNGKDFDDHIRPLERYLVSQVGRPWDKVWSDICKVLRGNGVQAAHVKQHVKWMVGGVPHSGESYFQDYEWHSPRGWQPVYVDEHGILRKNKKR